MDVLWLDAESAGASLAVHSRVTGVTAEAARKLVHVEDVNTGERSTVGARWLVNAAGVLAREGALFPRAALQGACWRVRLVLVGPVNIHWELPPEAVMAAAR
jgi:hypothetical protein